MQEYFKLFDNTFKAVKEVDERFRVGGPAVCGGSDEVWIRASVIWISNPLYSGKLSMISRVVCRLANPSSAFISSA